MFDIVDCVYVFQSLKLFVSHNKLVKSFCCDDMGRVDLVHHRMGVMR